MKKIVAHSEKDAQKRRAAFEERFAVFNGHHFSLEEIKEITAVTLRLKEISDDIMSLKGGKACPKCGALVKNGSMYCSACGTKIDDMFEED